MAGSKCVHDAGRGRVNVESWGTGERVGGEGGRLGGFVVGEYRLEHGRREGKRWRRWRLVFGAGAGAAFGVTRRLTCGGKG
jgi:hypothetical protein